MNGQVMKLIIKVNTSVGETWQFGFTFPSVMFRSLLAVLVVEFKPLMLSILGQVGSEELQRDSNLYLPLAFESGSVQKLFSRCKGLCFKSLATVQKNLNSFTIWHLNMSSIKLTKNTVRFLSRVHTQNKRDTVIKKVIYTYG